MPTPTADRTTIALAGTRGVLFDLDGTLLDTAPDMVGALNQLRSEGNLDPLPFEGVRGSVSHGATALVRLAFAEADEKAFTVLRARFLELYSGRLSAETRVYEGILEALERLESDDIPWGIVTNKPGWLAEPLLEQLALSQRAHVIVCGDTLAERKPHPAPLLYAAEKLGVTPTHCMYFGDAERDVLAAQAAGMKVYVAMYGYIPVNERPLEWPATGWLESPRALANLLESIGPRRAGGPTDSRHFMDSNKLNDFAARYTAAWCSQNAASVASFFGKQGSLQINDGSPSVGREAITKAAQGFMTAFPDLVVRMDRVNNSASDINFHWTLTGTNTGPGGTGKGVKISGFEEWRFGPDGLIADSKGHFDAAEYQRQLTPGISRP